MTSGWEWWRRWSKQGSDSPSAQTSATSYASPLFYLIAVDDQVTGAAGCITEPGYDAPPPRRGMFLQYGNLYDQTGSGRYGPYPHRRTDTSDQYNERVVDLHSDGGKRLLQDQCAKAVRRGAFGIEWDNPDGYSLGDVLMACDAAMKNGLKVAAKNPLACPWDSYAYVSHPAVIGIIVEKDDEATPAAYDALRRRCRKPDLPIWFVAFDDGHAWAKKTARSAASFKNMWVTYDPSGEEYADAELIRSA